MVLVTPPSALEIAWISLNVNDIWEYPRDVTLGTVRFCNRPNQQPRLPRGAVALICEFFLVQLDLGRVLSFIEKMSCKTEYASCSLRDRQSELMRSVSDIADRPTSLSLCDLYLIGWPSNTNSMETSWIANCKRPIYSQDHGTISKSWSVRGRGNVPRNSHVADPTAQRICHNVLSGDYTIECYR
jgi:hypothetical protein